MRTKFLHYLAQASILRAVIILSVLVGFPRMVLGQLQVVGSDPKQGSILANSTAGIEIAFNRAVDLGTLSAASIKVYGSYHGLYDLSSDFDTVSDILHILPSPAFIDGESITVILTTALRATDGSGLERPFRLAFRTLNPFGDVVSGFKILDIPLLRGDQLPAKITLGDFNQDDFIDAAVVNSTSNTVTILINTTRAQRFTTLSPAESFASGTTPMDITAADFDDDGNLDLAVVNFTSNNLSIHWGNNNGTFGATTPTTIGVGLRPSGVAVDDFNGDGRLDFAVSLFGEDKIVIYTNNGNGNFARSTELDAEKGTFGIASADFDGDGDADLAAINNGVQSVSFFQNQNLGGWRSLPAQSVPLRPIAMKWGNVLNQTADGPGDRLQELIVLSSDLTILGKPGTGPKRADDKSQFTVFEYDSLNNRMVEAQAFTYGNRAQAFDLASLDSDLASGLFERDHDLDLVLADYMGGGIQYLTNLDNAGWFTSFASLDTSANPRAIVLADFNRDGTNDILYTNHLLNKLRLLLMPFRIGGRGRPLTFSADFGDVLVGTTKQINLPASLYGSFDVDVTVEVQDEQNFDAAPRFFELRDGQPFPLSLFFSPRDTLEFETKAILISTHPLEQVPSVIVMRGHGIDVDFSISPAVLDFRTVPPGLSKTLDLNVTNNANGILALTNLESALAEFSHEGADTIYVQPYGRQDIPVTFSPQIEGAYIDTLFISSNDISKPRVAVLLLGKSATGVPHITSADTATATEHKFFFYIATAEDPDGDQIDFRFSNFPNWLQAGADSLYGVPPEGATDSGFTVTASDGFLEDSLEVYIRVIPVNDPPRFANLDVQQVVERDRLAFTVSATDPEGELLSLSAQNLPDGATFMDRGNNSATFDWTPSFRSAGRFDVTFFAVETVSSPALTDTLVGRILVGRRKPDLVVNNIQLSRADIRLRQEATISAQVNNENAPVLESFLVRISVDGVAVFDTTIVEMESDEAVQISARAKFDRLGGIPVVVQADVNNAVSEISENNNQQEIVVSVAEGELIVRPNPFTPNGDNKNDFAMFDVDQLALANPMLSIFSLKGRRIRTIIDMQNDKLRWDGRNESGREQLPGVYLYILQDGGQNVAQGYVVLAR